MVAQPKTVFRIFPAERKTAARPACSRSIVLLVVWRTARKFGFGNAGAAPHSCFPTRTEQFRGGSRGGLKRRAPGDVVSSARRRGGRGREPALPTWKVNGGQMKRPAVF